MRELLVAEEKRLEDLLGLGDVTPPPVRYDNMAVMSLSTKVGRFKLTHHGMMMLALACNLNKRWFQHVRFITDRRGLELIQGLGIEFDSTSTVLDRTPIGEKPSVWAQGKLYALLSVKDADRVFHLDNDFFFCSSPTEEFLNGPLVAQSCDPHSFYEATKIEKVLDLLGMSKDDLKFNTGVFGGANIPLLRAFLFYSLDKLKNLDTKGLSGTVVSLAIEQVAIGIFARRCGVEITLLEEYTPIDGLGIGWVHLMGALKEDKTRLVWVEKLFRREFPQQYRKFNMSWDLFLSSLRPSRIGKYEPTRSKSSSHRNPKRLQKGKTPICKSFGKSY